MTAPPPPPETKIRFGQPSGSGGSIPGFGRSGALAGIVLVVLLLGGLVWSAAVGQTVSAEHPQLFGGSLVLEDNRPLPVIDMATAKVTVRLEDVSAQVGADSDIDVQAVPVQGGTMLVNSVTGTFNLLGEDDYLVDPNGPGVGLGKLAGSSQSEGLAAGADAYIIRSGPKSTASLVSEATVAAAAKLESPATAAQAAPARSVTAAPADQVTPPGFSALAHPVDLTPGAATVNGMDLWVLENEGTACAVVDMHPVATGHDGLLPTSPLTLPLPCRQAGLESTAGVVGLASPGAVRLFLPAAGSKRPETRVVKVPGTTSARAFLPVTGATSGFWYLAASPAGWSLIGISSGGRVAGPFSLSGLGPQAQPSVPAVSNGFLYTLDQAQGGQPGLWAIDLANGHMAPVSGATTYPAFSRTEKVPFGGAQVIGDGPRVVFNNPQSIDAVVVFTDGSRAPAVIDKSDAETVSASGPADLNVTSKTPKQSTGAKGASSQTRPVPALQPVSQQITCASTTQKPYSPQITTVNLSSATALVAWSYQLFDQTDCEPDSWSVTVRALSGSHQPAQPVQTENGQDQYLFVGLRPATTYQAYVTAYINTQSTASTPVTFTTTERGPDAPLSVTTKSDGNGSWVVSWVPCTETANANCVVPAETWSVVGAACAGSAGLSEAPSAQVPGSQTSVTIDSDSIGLLGNFATFTVQGSLVSGLNGNPTSDHSCTEAWRPPNAQDITLHAAGHPSQSGSTITATLQVDTTESPVEAFGSQDTDFVYQVGDVTLPPTTKPTVTIPGLAAGQQYTGSVTVYPAGHPASSVTVHSTPFTQTVPWPTVNVAVDPSVTSNPNVGSLAVSFGGLPAGSFTATGTIVCGETTVGVNSPLANGSFTFPNFNLDSMGGGCTLTAVLDDTANPNPYGVASPALTTSFEIGTQPAYSFSATVSEQCQVFCVGNQEEIDVDYLGPGAAPEAGIDWIVSASGPTLDGAHSCTVPQNPQPSADPPSFPVALFPGQNPLCNPDLLSVTVQYTYLGSTQTVTVGQPSGTFGTTTTSSSTTSTTSATTTSTTTACPTSTTDTTCGSSPPSTGGQNRPMAGNPAVRSTLGGALIGIPVMWLAVGVRRLTRRNGSGRPAKKGHT